MPKYEVTRSYYAASVATISATSHEHAEEIARFELLYLYGTGTGVDFDAWEIKDD